MPHPIPDADQPPVDRLRKIMHILRAPGGCPWDAEQTHESLAPHLIEEAYEEAAKLRDQIHSLEAAAAAAEMETSLK